MMQGWYKTVTCEEVNQVTSHNHLINCSNFPHCDQINHIRTQLGREEGIERGIRGTKLKCVPCLSASRGEPLGP
jgi:ssDNA-binding Zn-finger/Zn-ribbon topoisomerase 1